jgi:hypothetical protein
MTAPGNAAATHQLTDFPLSLRLHYWAIYIRLTIVNAVDISCLWTAVMQATVGHYLSPFTMKGNYHDDTFAY